MQEQIGLINGFIFLCFSLTGLLFGSIVMHFMTPPKKRRRPISTYSASPYGHAPLSPIKKSKTKNTNSLKKRKTNLTKTHTPYHSKTTNTTRKKAPTKVM